MTFAGPTRRTASRAAICASCIIRAPTATATTRLLLAGSGHGGTEALETKEFQPRCGAFETKYDVFDDARMLGASSVIATR